MYVTQRVIDGLGCLSYMIADEQAGEAVVVDPDLDVEHYVKEAGDAGLVIRHVVDTHLHADHVSGNRALAAVTGASIHLPRRADATFPHETLEEGSEIRIGEVVLRVRETPGHTPEHVSLEIHDESSGSDEPYAVLSGDTLFVGSVGRPDLVGTSRAADLAASMFDTIADVFSEFGDGVILYPGHGAGSACGARMSRLLLSTIGREKRTNPYLSESTSESFVRHVTEDLPRKPGNALAIKRINTEGAPRAGTHPDEVLPLDPERFEEEVEAGVDAFILDVREPDAFAANHVPGSINVARSQPAFASRAATFLESGKPVYLVLDEDSPETLAAVLLQLSRVGGLDVRGHLEGGMNAWRMAGRSFATLRAMSAENVRAALAVDLVEVLDVRSDDEWADGHIDGALHIPWESLPERLDEMDASASWVVTCASGYRSSMAASVLLSEGFDDVANLLGGMAGWTQAGYAVTTPPRRGEVAGPSTR